MGRCSQILGVYFFCTNLVCYFGPISKVGCFGLILEVNHFSLIHFCLCVREGTRDPGRVVGKQVRGLFCFGKADKRTAMFLMVSGCLIT